MRYLLVVYRSSSGLACPACGGGLEPPRDLPVHGCRACGGVWLGPEAAVHVMRGQGDATDEALVATAQRTASSRSTPPRVPDGSARVCPVCRSALFPLDLAGVTVESCPAHGTWFDEREVERVVARTTAAREVALRKARGEDLSLEDVASTAAALLTAAVTLPFTLVDRWFYRDTCNVCGARLEHGTVHQCV